MATRTLCRRCSISTAANRGRHKTNYQLYPTTRTSSHIHGALGAFSDAPPRKTNDNASSANACIASPNAPLHRMLTEFGSAIVHEFFRHQEWAYNSDADIGSSCPETDFDDECIDFEYLRLHSSIFIKFAFHFFHMGPRDVYLDSPIEAAHSEPRKIRKEQDYSVETGLYYFTSSVFEFPILGRSRSPRLRTRS